MSENQQEAKVITMNKDSGNSPIEDNVPATKGPQIPQEKMFLISEKAASQLLNTIAELPGLTWKQTNPIIVFIQQNIVAFN